MTQRIGWEGHPDLEVLRAMYRDGKTSSEIAQATGRTLNAVNNKISTERAMGLERATFTTH